MQGPRLPAALPSSPLSALGALDSRCSAVSGTCLGLSEFSLLHLGLETFKVIIG